MEPEASLPHSYVPAPVPIRSQFDQVHAPTSNFLKIHHNIILRHVSEVVSFPQVSPPKPCIRPSSRQ